MKILFSEYTHNMYTQEIEFYIFWSLLSKTN